jgi:hypothetical protein
MHERREEEEESGEKIAFVETTTTTDDVEDVGATTTRDSLETSASRVDADAHRVGKARRKTTTTKATTKATTYAAYGGAATIGTYILYRIIRWALGRDDHGTFGSVPDRKFSATHRKCNRCGARGSQVRVKCERCKRCWYCSQACKKAAWSMEICECC